MSALQYVHVHLLHVLNVRLMLLQCCGASRRKQNAEWGAALAGRTRMHRQEQASQSQGHHVVHMCNVLHVLPLLLARRNGVGLDGRGSAWAAAGALEQ